MKILEIIPQLSSGGAERFVVDLCNHLSDSNDVTLLVYYNLDDYGFYFNELSKKVKVVSLNKKQGFSPSVFVKVFNIIRNIKPDVVHIHLSSILYVWPTSLFYRKSKYFMTIHSEADKEAEGKVGTCIRKFCFKNNLIAPVTISAQSLNSFIIFYRIKAKIIFNGRTVAPHADMSEDLLREFEEYRKTSSSRVIVNLASFTPLKRQPLIAKVARRLYAEGEDFSLLMIGNTRNKEMLDEVMSIKSPNVFVLGERTNPVEYLQLADGFCLVSLYEGMPMSLIEALGVGAVPICTPVGGIVDVIKDGENGFLASDLSEESVYNAFKRFLHTSPEELQNIKDNVIKSYAQFTMSECASRYLELFNGKAI